ncbi:MAG: cell division protein ZapA [Calditrichaeota bacterium]|nr:cell division protein ZapA [Calditrichota bacterium]
MNNPQIQSPLITVNIYGQEYPIRGNSDEEYIRSVARYVDECMLRIEEQTSIKTPTRLAILAALNIADELFTIKREKERILLEFEEKARELSDVLNQSISGC